MADSTAGEPLAGRHLWMLYSVQSEKGTAVTPATAVGIVDVDVTSDAGLLPIYNIGGPNALFIEAGMSQVQFSIPLRAIQDDVFLSKSLRSSGVLPWLTLGFGYTDDEDNTWGWQVQDCKLHSGEAACEAGALLTGSVTGVGGLITELSEGAMANLSATPFKWHEAVFTKGGSAHECRSFRFAWSNGVEVQPCIAGAAPSSFKRGWKYQTEGNFEITGEVVRYAKSGINLQAATISDFALQAVFTDLAGGMSPNTITFAASNAKYGSEKFAGQTDGGVLFTLPFTAKSFAIS